MTQTQALIYNLMYMQPCHADYTKYNISTLTTWKDFADVWASADNDYKLPTLSLTAEEEEVYSAANSDVETYMDEVIIKFIIGDMDIDAEWDTYLQTMESLGVQDMIDTYNAAYTRYQNK
jgi:putative aldouronate transport system substrate-binding protein